MSDGERIGRKDDIRTKTGFGRKLMDTEKKVRSQLHERMWHNVAISYGGVPEMQGKL